MYSHIQFGTLKEVRLMHNKEKKPYAFVEFLTEDAAVQAAAMNGTDIDGHKMQVNFSRVAAPARLGLAKSLGYVVDE